MHSYADDKLIEKAAKGSYAHLGVLTTEGQEMICAPQLLLQFPCAPLVGEISEESGLHPFAPVKCTPPGGGQPLAIVEQEAPKIEKEIKDMYNDAKFLLQVSNLL